MTNIRIVEEGARNLNQTFRAARKLLSQNPITDSDTDQYEPINPNDKKGR